MDFKNEQYKLELEVQERHANRRILAGFNYVSVMYFLVYVLSVIGIFDMDFVVMTSILAVVMLLSVVASNLGRFVELSKPWLKYILLLLISILCGIIVMILTIHVVLLYALPLLFAIQCRQRKVLWYTFAVNTVTMAVSSLIGFYYGICDLNVLLGQELNYKGYMKMLAGNYIMIPPRENTTLIVLAFEVLPRIMILFVFALMLQETMLRSSEDAVRIAELTWRKERDITTKVFNKNKFEEMADEYYPTLDKISAVYFDLNNLKKTNDVYGHAEGDSLIMLLSKCLMEQGDKRYRVYRLGGDEFLMTIDNPQIHETERAIREVKDRLAGQRTPNGLTVTSAVGWSMGEGREFRQIVKTADANMYANKVAGKEGRNR